MNIVEAKNHLAPRPTKVTLFLRSFLPWQLIRFMIINLRMTIMITKSHGHRLPPKTQDDSSEKAVPLKLN